MLKRISVFCVCLMATTLLSAQMSDTTRTLIKISKPKAWGLYVAPEVQYSQAAGEFTPFTGASAMLILNQRFAIGATAMRSQNRNFVPKSTSPLYYSSGFGGLKMEYTIKPTSIVHISFPLVVGMGFASADSTQFGRDFPDTPSNDSTDIEENRGDRGNRGDGRLRNADRHFVLQPGINIETNLLSFAKLYVGANYRLGFRQENNSPTLAADAMNGFAISAGLKIGFFNAGFKLPKFKHRRFGRRHEKASNIAPPTPPPTQ